MWPQLPSSCSCWCDVPIYGHLFRCVMCHSHHMPHRAFNGRQVHWAALASFIQSIAGDVFSGYLMPCNDLPQLTSVKSIKTSPFCWCEPPRTHFVRDYKGVVQSRAQSFRDVAFSYPKRPQSLESHCSKLLSPCHVFDIPQQ